MRETERERERDAYIFTCISLPPLPIVDGQGSTTIHYDDRAIDALLDRDQEGEIDEGPGSDNLLANEYLSSFKVASYVMKEKVIKQAKLAQFKCMFMQHYLT